MDQIMGWKRPATSDPFLRWPRFAGDCSRFPVEASEKGHEGGRAAGLSCMPPVGAWRGWVERGAARVAGNVVGVMGPPTRTSSALAKRRSCM